MKEEAQGSAHHGEGTVARPQIQHGGAKLPANSAALLASPPWKEPVSRLHPKTGPCTLSPNGIKPESAWGPLERGRFLEAWAYCRITRQR